jgi:hypothetical protein
MAETKPPSASDKPKSPKDRVTRAVKDRNRADRLRIDSEYAYKRGDNLMGRVNLEHAAEADKAADDGLNHWNYAARPSQRGRGGELVPLLDNTPEGFGSRQHKVMTVEEPMHVLAHQASADAMDLLIENDALGLGLEMADSVKAKGRVEKMLAHQMATLHSLGMRLAGKADKELRRIEEASVFKADAKRQAAIVETARLTNATARALAAFNEAALTLQRLRTGGRQVVTVQHVTVNDGGQAVVAQTMKAGRKSRGQKRRGRGEKP